MCYNGGMPYKNAEDRKNWSRKYYEENKEPIKARARANWWKKRDQNRATSRKYYEENKQTVKQKNAKYAKANPHIGQKRHKNYYWNKRRKVLEAVGGEECVRCGFTDIRALQVDHINGGGKKHIESFSSHAIYNNYIIANPQEFQILCANCNRIKVHENKEWRKGVNGGETKQGNQGTS